MRAVALRYALAPACILLAVLLHLSPVGPTLSLAGLFVFAVLAAAWFGGAGPGFVAAVLATFTLPQLIAVSYPLLGGFLDLPRFITFAVEGIAVGWGSSRRARVLRDQERYARAMNVSDDGLWDWIPADDTIYTSPRLLEIYGFAPGTNFAGRNDLLAQIPFHPDDRPLLMRAFAEHFAGKTVRYDVETRFIRDGETRWVHLTGMAARDPSGAVVRWTGTVRDVTERKRAEEALRASEERYSLAMDAAGDGHTDWNLVTGEFYISPRLLEILGYAPGTTFADRADWVRRFPFHPEDRPRWEAAIAAHFAGREAKFRMDLRIVVNGETRWVAFTFIATRDASGKPVRWTGSIADIHDAKLAADELRESEARFRALTELSSDWYWEQDEDLRFTYLSGQVGALTGYSGESSLGKARWEIETMEPLSCSWPEHQAVLAARQPFRDLECRRIGPDGTVRYLSMSGAPVFDEGGRFKGYQGIGRNITERKRAEEKLRESEALKSAMFETALDCIISIDHDGRVIEFNPAAERTFGYQRAEAMGKELAELIIPPRLREQHRRGLARYLATGEGPVLGTRIEMPAVRADGAEFPVELSVTRIPAEGAPLFTAYLRDITARKAADEAVRESEARFRSLTELSSDWYWRQDEQLRFNYTSRQPGETTDYPSEWVIGKTRWELPGITPLSFTWPEHQAALAARRPFRDLEYARAGLDGTHYVSISGAPIFDDQGVFRGYQGIGRDITERKRIEEELRSRQEMLELAQHAARAIAFEWRFAADGPDSYHWSLGLAAMHGVAPESYDGSLKQYKKLIHPEDWPRVKDAIQHAQRTGDVDAEYRVLHSDGSVHWLQAKGRMFFDTEGKPARMVGFMHDVTQRRQAEEEFKTMERKLRQAQRLEAMGTLAGGIAHDFNNILGAILGYGEMALRDAPKGSRLRRDLGSIITAGERGRALVDRVLAFSRSGVGERVPVHVEKVVREALDLVSAKLPPEITLQDKLHAGRAAMLGDATQVHQVLMNLATNAIQAMPAGGTLRVSLRTVRLETARAPTIGILEPGNYLALEVADSGTGIAPEMLDRIFDPFFTTKEVGTGTGLGLSLVHGIVSEVGGAIDVASVPGKGSTFTVYLPHSGDAEDSPQREEVELPRGEGQRVLVVDDEEPLVKLATRTLEELGYAAVGFTSSTAALAAFRADPQRFDALITDERMPGMSGSALIREVRGIRDRIPIVLMSGYVGGAVASRAREAGAEEVLKKPLSARDLAASLARVLQS
jgi:PAS domain S-box-containing protein